MCFNVRVSSEGKILKLYALDYARLSFYEFLKKVFLFNI